MSTLQLESMATQTSGSVPHLYSGPHLYDQVRLIDNSEGVVKYIGEVAGKNGTFFGLELLSGSYHTATTNGCVGDQQYFTTTSNNVKVGRFVTDDEIQSIMKPSHNLPLIGEAPPFCLGDRVFVEKKNCNGMVHYIGVPKFAKNPKIFIGVELDEPKGNCNGTLASCTYFTCDDKYGLYQVPKNLTLAQEEVTVDLDEFQHSENTEEKEAVPDELQSESLPQPTTEEKEDALIDEKENDSIDPQPATESVTEPVVEPKVEAEPKSDPEPQADPEKEPESKPEPQPEPAPASEPEPQPQQEPEPEPEPIVEANPATESAPEIVKPAPNSKEIEPVQAEAKVDDDYKDITEVTEAPKLEPKVEVDPDGTETIYPTYMTNLCIKARTHSSLKNYKTINYSSKKYQVDDGLIQQRLEELSKKVIAPRGHFAVDDTKFFAYCLVKEPHEWRAALRINTDDANDAQRVLNYIQGKTQAALENVEQIQAFNWDRNFQGLVMDIRKANM